VLAVGATLVGSDACEPVVGQSTRGAVGVTDDGCANDWHLVGIGHHTDTDRELAIAHAERIREQRTRWCGSRARGWS
jgi:hypothetical protein